MSSPVREGEVVADKYRVEHVVGQGGMGVVVAAKHLELDQRVALKFLQPEAVSDGASVRRFKREARAAVRLRSEHVARVYDVGELSSGTPFMVLEYLEGDDLRDVMRRRGRVSVEEAVEYVLQACEAVAEAHALGIVHRDLKPANLFLAARRDGTRCVKVLDFGVSKSTTLDVASSASLTGSCSVLGSPLYMSPEQMRSARGVDERTDIWSLGVILYELVTGLVPFDAPTMPQLCAAILERPPRSMRALCADVPEELDALVLRCLDKNPAGRPASIAALSADLAPFAPRGARLHVERIARMLSAPAPSDLGETEPDGASAAGGSDASGLVAARSPGMRAARAGVFGGAVGALLVLGALATWHAVSRRTPAEPAPSALALPTSLVVTSASVPGAVSELGMATASAAPASADAGASGGIAGRADARPPTGAHPSGSSVVSGPAPGARASSSSGAAAKRPDDEAFTDRK